MQEPRTIPPAHYYTTSGNNLPGSASSPPFVVGLLVGAVLIEEYSSSVQLFVRIDRK